MGFEEGARRCGFRSPELMRRIVLTVHGEGGEPVRVVELLGRVDPDDRWSEATIEGAIRDLRVFGALWVKGPPASRRFSPDRAVALTDLGAALVEGRLVGIEAPWERVEVPR